MIPFFIHEIFDNAANIYSDNTYIFERGKIFTYSDFVKCGTNITSLFKDVFYIKKGDHVVCLNGGSSLLYLTLYACSKLGAVLIPLNPNFRGKRLDSVLSHSNPKLIIADNKDISNYKTISSQQIYNFIKKVSRQYVHTGTEIIDLDPSIIFLTSGSTGTPKGIVHSHSSVICATESIARYLDIKATDRILNLLPYFFDYGFYQGLICASRGASLILGENLMFFKNVTNIIKESKVSIIPLVPTQFRLIFSNCSGDIFSTVKKLTNTGAPLPIDILDGIQSIFPNAHIFSMYGLTECKRTTYLPPEKLLAKPNSVGKSIPNCRVFLVDQDRNIIDKPWIVGQLVIEGRNLMNNYCFFDNNNLNADPLQIEIQQYGSKRLLYSGDFFQYDEEFDLFFVGRQDDIVKIDDYRVSLKDIENIIKSITGVNDAAVVKVIENNSTFIVSYCISSELSEKEISREIGKIVESRQLIPSYFFILPSFPLTENQKIDYAKLSSLASKHIKNINNKIVEQIT